MRGQDLKIKGISLSFRNFSHDLSDHDHLSRWQSPQSDCNLYNQTAICIKRLQSPQFDSNFYNQTAISTIELQSTQSGQLQLQLQLSTAIKLQSQQSDCNLSNQTAISTIRQQSLQLDCYLHKQTSISTIRLQSAQSMIRFYHVFPIGVQLPECGKHLPHCYISISKRNEFKMKKFLPRDPPC